MEPVMRTVTLSDVVMGKMGIRYTLAEMVTILNHYDINPLQNPTRSRKLTLFRQLHELAYDQNLTARHRRLILSGQMPGIEKSNKSSRVPSDSMEESDINEATEVPMPHIEPQHSIMPLVSTCSVCLEKHFKWEFPRSRITTGCPHEPTICLECLQQAISSQIDNRNWNKLTCPLCNEKLSFEAVKRYSSSECFEKYDRHATMHALRAMPNFCMCMGPGCDSGQIHVSGSRQPIMTCKACDFKTCFTHQMPWHEGMTCVDYDQAHNRHDEENEASLELLRTVGLICPKCSIPGIKTDGCDHMTCPLCDYQYCARCLASYESIRKVGNTAHKSTCPYHTSRLPSDEMEDPEGFVIENGNLLPWEDEVEDGEARNIYENLSDDFLVAEDEEISIDPEFEDEEGSDENSKNNTPIDKVQPLGTQLDQHMNPPGE